MSQPASTPKHTARGFSLLELSIVIGIIALIAGVGVNMASGALKAADRVTTQERLNTTKLAIDSFAKTYGYYPCPADRTQTPSAATYGTAVASCSAASSGIETISTNMAIGALPVRTLGLPDTYGGDAWGNKLTYAVSTNLTVDPTRAASRNPYIVVKYGTNASNFNINSMRSNYAYTTVTNPSGAIAQFNGGALPSDLVVGTVVYPGGTVYPGSYIVTAIGANFFQVTGYTATDSNTVDYQSSGSSAAYVVVSHGPDGRGAYPMWGTAVPGNKLCNNSATANTSPAPCTSSGNLNCIDIQNCQTGSGTSPLDGTFFDTTYNDGTIDTVYFDDYIIWGSNASMRIPVNPSLYTSSTTSNCPAGTCEAWCAACVLNYPFTAPGTAVPPTGTLNNATFPAISLCKKVINTNSSTCTASCFWSGSTNDATPKFYRCP